MSLDTIISDLSGQQRKLGLLLPPTGFVSSMPVWEDNVPDWSDAEIKDAITDRQRRLGRKLFGRAWTRDQGSVGSCNGWALSGAYGRSRYLRGFTDGMQFSGSWAYSLMNGGADRGSALEDGLKVGMVNGLAELSLCPPNQIYPSQQTRRTECLASASQHKSFRCYAVKTQRGYRTALAKGFPVIVAVHAGGNFQRMVSGVAGVDNGPGNHAILADDLVLLPDGREVSDVQNSWGLGYGENGRAYLTWASFAQTFNVHLFYAIASTQEGDG
jgi:hypothetical protein